MATNVPWPSIHASIMRLTALDECGVPLFGQPATLVSDGVVRVASTSEYEDGEETYKKNGAGKPKVVHKDPDQLKYISLEIEFVGVDPQAWGLITGMPVMTNYAGDATGLRLGNYDTGANFALELWTDIPGTPCGADGKPYGYFCWPWVGQGRVGDLELAETAADFTLSATTKSGAAWAEGPYDVALHLTDPEDPDSGTIAGPLLEPATSKDHVLLDQVNVPPPAATGELVMLPVP